LTDKEIKDAINRYVWGWRQKLVLERRKRILERLESMGPEAIRAAPSGIDTGPPGSPRPE
jgi:hypothetical protein